MQLSRLSLEQAQEGIRSREWACSDLVHHCLQRINEGNDLNAFISVYGDDALAQADALTAKIRAGKGGRLAGLVLAVKDNIVIKRRQVTCGSRILRNYISPFDATVIKKLQAADAVIPGLIKVSGDFRWQVSLGT